MRKNWISCILAMAMLLFLFAIPVMAEESDAVLTPIESDELGSIRIQLADTNAHHPKGNVTLAVVQVADVINGEFVLKEKYEGLGVELNKIKTASELDSAAKALQSAGVSADDTVVTDDDGVAAITNLPTGVYLISALDIADYEYIAASLISIPAFNKEEGSMDYDIDVFPKHSAVLKPPKTGDLSEIRRYGFMLAVSFVLVVGLGVILKHRRN